MSSTRSSTGTPSRVVARTPTGIVVLERELGLEPLQQRQPPGQPAAVHPPDHAAADDDDHLAGDDPAYDEHARTSVAISPSTTSSQGEDASTTDWVSALVIGVSLRSDTSSLRERRPTLNGVYHPSRGRIGLQTWTRRPPVGEAGGVPLYWKVFLINGTVLCAATLVLVLAPVSVSRQVVVSEVVVLAVGLGIMLLANALVLRSSLAPVDRVIREMRAEQTSSNARALAAQEAERHRIAQELHDEVGQHLTVVLLGLKQVEQRAPADIAAELALLREATRDGLDDVRRVARQLRPGVLEDLGLTSALASLTNDFAEHSGASVRRGRRARAAGALGRGRARRLPGRPGGADQRGPPRRRATPSRCR